MATTNIDRLKELLGERIVLLDGSWGVLLQGRGITEEEWRGERFADHSHDVKGNPDLLNLTKPEVVAEIHRAYFAAGADIATTNTFTATSIGQADYALEDAVYELNLAGARLAREAADEVQGFVAGSVGPLNVALSLSPKVDDPSYRSATFDRIRDAYAEQMRPFVHALAQIAPTYVACHPNAGLPNEMGSHDEQPADTSRFLGEFAHDGLVNVVGGCCGTRPEHIEAIARAVKGAR